MRQRNSVVKAMSDQKNVSITNNDPGTLMIFVYFISKIPSTTCQYVTQGNDSA